MRIQKEYRTSNISLERVSITVGYVRWKDNNNHIAFTIWRTKDLSIMKTAWDDKWRLCIGSDVFCFERKRDALDYAVTKLYHKGLIPEAQTRKLLRCEGM